MPKKKPQWREGLAAEWTQLYWEQERNPASILVKYEFIAQEILGSPEASPREKRAAREVLKWARRCRAAIEHEDLVGAVVAMHGMTHHATKDGLWILCEPSVTEARSRRKHLAAISRSGGRAKADGVAARNKVLLQNASSLRERKPDWSARRIAGELSPGDGRNWKTLHPILTRAGF